MHQGPIPFDLDKDLAALSNQDLQASAQVLLHVISSLRDRLGQVRYESSEPPIILRKLAGILEAHPQFDSEVELVEEAARLQESALTLTSTLHPEFSKFAFESLPGNRPSDIRIIGKL